MRNPDYTPKDQDAIDEQMVADLEAINKFAQKLRHRIIKYTISASSFAEYETAKKQGGESTILAILQAIEEN